MSLSQFIYHLVNCLDCRLKKIKTKSRQSETTCRLMCLISICKFSIIKVYPINDRHFMCSQVNVSLNRFVKLHLTVAAIQRMYWKRNTGIDNLSRSDTCCTIQLPPVYVSSFTLFCLSGYEKLRRLTR